MSNWLKEFNSLFKRFVLAANVLPALFGFLLASRYYGIAFQDYWLEFVLLMLGSVLLIAGALTLNNWLEADVDKLMERTQKRPTVTGTLSLRTVLIIGIILSSAGQLVLLLINLEVALYGFIGWYTYVVIYTIWTKRRVTWNTHVGSVSGAVTPLMGWAVIDSAIHPIPLSLFVIMFLWQMPHTYAIAIRKFDDYKRAGLKMLPVVKGYQVTIRRNAVYIALLLLVPFLVQGFSLSFYVLITLLNTVWLLIALYGFKADPLIKWANILFGSSLGYLMTVFILYLLFVPV
ncbi:heme o synthase [Gracilibacillus alcaliphilus]|uniref:heme o synthase n=1 Tax=Gracilibacillus alcaliphilus TaxID=1401441 RepID=UPI00195676DE|nr:heme o synthase [Gracilibacillus alcaliphilus]MBM7677653.1 protoheme IX farnesyltransferase [Gracilibacillus alcaliphilus]